MYTLSGALDNLISMGTGFLGGMDGGVEEYVGGGRDLEFMMGGKAREYI